MKEIVVNGVCYQSIAEACRALRVSYSSVRKHANTHNVIFTEAFNLVKSRSKYRYKDHEGRYFVTLPQMAKYHGIPYSTFWNRLQQKLPLEICLSKQKFNGRRNLKNELQHIRE